MIDFTKKIALADGTPMTFVRRDGQFYRCRFEGQAGQYYPGQSSMFRADGSHRWGRVVNIVNVADVKPAVDPTKPMELSDGTPVTLNTRYSANGGYYNSVKTHIAITAGGSHYVYNVDGTHAYKLKSETLRNVAPKAPALDLTKPLQTSDGKKVRLLASNATGLKPLVVEVEYRSGSVPMVAIEQRFADGRTSSQAGRTSGDDIVNVREVTREYRNIYSDGTIGVTVHKTMTAAKSATKFGKLRVAILETVKVDGVFDASAVHTEGVAQYRTASGTKTGIAAKEAFLVA